MNLSGVYGLSAYCGSKFALRGLAESLAMEVFHYNMTVTLCSPPDTDTPGLAAEQSTKPLETKLISASAGLEKPEDVAERMVDDSLVRQNLKRKSCKYPKFLVVTKTF